MSVALSKAGRWGRAIKARYALSRLVRLEPAAGLLKIVPFVLPKVQRRQYARCARFGGKYFHRLAGLAVERRSIGRATGFLRGITVAIQPCTLAVHHPIRMHRMLRGAPALLSAFRTRIVGCSRRIPFNCSLLFRGARSSGVIFWRERCAGSTRADSCDVGAGGLLPAETGPRSGV